jgi:hypothetical protein
MLKVDGTSPRLVDLLPPAVEDFGVYSFKMLSGYWGGLAKQLLSELPVIRRALIPSLQRISFAFPGIDIILSLKYPVGTHHRTEAELLEVEDQIHYTLIEYLTWLKRWYHNPLTT